jgi:hypothetical protein
MPSLPPSAVEELGFWEGELKLRGKHPEDIARRLDPRRRREVFPRMLAEPILPLLRQHFRLDRPAKCVEIGPGPLSTLAWGVDEGLLEVHAVDVLATEFAALLARHDITYPVRPIPGTGEDLLAWFPPASFELAYARNALDHTDDAPRTFDHLVKLVRVDGAIVLQHHLQEGTRQGWSASHKWNLDLGEGGLVATRRGGVRIELGRRDDVELLYVEYRSKLLDGWIDVVYRRR